MLDACAPGYRIRETTHTDWILYNGRTYYTFPKYKEIPVGHIKKMLRTLQIDITRAREFLPILQ